MKVRTKQTELEVERSPSGGAAWAETVWAIWWAIFPPGGGPSLYVPQSWFEVLFTPIPAPSYHVMQKLGNLNGRTLWVDKGEAADETQGRALVKQYEQRTPNETFALWWSPPGG